MSFDDPIYKTKEGQQVTKKQLLESGYSEDRISKGLTNGILSEIGNTNASGQAFKTSDGQQVTYDDLVNSGYSEERINKGVQNGILTAVEKKNQDGNGLEVDSKGNLQPSVHTPSQSKSSVPDFGMASFSDLAKGQKNVSENTQAIAPKQQEQYVDVLLHSGERQKVKKENILKALDTTTKKALKLKGVNAQEGSAAYNQEKSKQAFALETGDAHVALDENGIPGLKRTTGAFENLKKGWNEAISGDAENQSFANMTPKERVDFYNQNKNNPDKVKPVDEYIGETPSLVGSASHLLSSSAPYIAKAGLGAAISSATGGIVAPAAMAFLLTTPSMINAGIKDKVLSDFEVLQHQHPERSQEENMAEASKYGDLVGGIEGLATNTIFNASLGKSLSAESKGLLKNGMEHVFKPAVKIGLTTAGITAAGQEVSNLEGIHRTQAEIFKNSMESLKDNATSGLVLMGAFHLPNALKSLSKYILLKEENPQNIEGVLKINEDKGLVSAGTTEKFMTDLAGYKNALDKVPAGLTPESEASVAGLIQKKINLTEEAKTKDDSFKPVYKEKIDAINQQISDIQRTGKPFEHEIDEATGEHYKQPTFDDVAKQRVQDLADKIANGKRIEDAVDLQTQANFPDELEKQLHRIAKEEKSSNKDKVNPKTELTDNIDKYISSQSKTQKNASTQSEGQQQSGNEQGSITEYARTESTGSSTETAQTTGSDSNIGSEGQKEKVADKGVGKTAPLIDSENKAIEAVKGIDFNTPDGKKVKGWTDVLQDDKAPIEKKRLALHELHEQLTDPDSEIPTGTGLGKAADAIYDLPYEVKKTESLLPVQSTVVGDKKIREDNADMARDILDESSIDKDSNPLTLEEKDNIHVAINDYEDGKISGEDLRKAMLDNGLKEKYITKALSVKLTPNIETQKINQIQLPTSKVKETKSAEVKSLSVDNSVEGKKMPFEEFKDNVLNMAQNMTDSKFEHRITLPDMSQAQREKAVADIRAGRETIASKKLEAHIQNMYDRGVISMNSGRGLQAKSHDIPLEQWFGEPLTQHELDASQKIDDNAVSIINEEGLTLDNIDNVKHLFNESGFPYTEQDFKDIKAYLSRQSESDAANQKIGESSQNKQEIKNEEGVGNKPPPTIAEKGKELADKIRQLKTKHDKLQTNIFGIPIAVYDGAIESIATAVEAGAELAEAIQNIIKDIRDTHVGFQEDDFVKHLEDFAKGEKPKVRVQVGEEPPPEPPINENINTQSDNEGKIVGVSHASLSELAKNLGLKEPERGDYIEPQEYAERGRQLLKAGATLDDVNNTNNDLHDRISIARAHLEDLINNADKVAKDSGIESKEYKDALGEVEKYANDSVKKLGTLAHRAFVSLQGERDLNTGSFTAVKKAFEEKKGAKASPEQEKKIAELTKENENLKQKTNALEKRLIEETDKNLAIDKQENIGKAKKIIEGNKKIKDENVDLIFQSAKRDFVAARVAKEVSEGKTVEQSVDDIGKDGLIKPENIDKVKKYFNDLIEEKGTKKSKNKLSDLMDMFVGKKDNKFTPEEAKSIWDYAKEEYLDKGIAYKDMIAYVSNDLGLTWKQVYEAITSPKTKRLSDEMWRKQADLRRAQIITKDYVEKANNNVFVKALKGVSDLFRGAAVFGHGGIFVGTHAGMTFFDLPRTKYTIKAFLNAWKFAYGNKAAYERQMQALKGRPNFSLAERAGLQNDPQETSKDEYQKFQKVFRFLGGEAGIKGFNAIKILRQDLFDSHFNKLNAAQKADPSSAESVAHLVNNATGGTNLNLPKWTQEVAFAANMEAARWEKLTSNPVKATTTALKAIFTPEKATNAERIFAKVWASRVGWEIATYASILAANAVIQNLLNPDNKVNLSDPLKSDYLKYKVGENTIDMTSGMMGAIGFVGKLSHAGWGSQKSLYGDTRMEAAGKSAIGYARGKLSPFAGTVTELTLAKTDFSGNPLPFSTDKPKKGKHTLTWSEYAWQKAPIPVADAAKTIYDGMRENGMNKVQANNWLYGLITMFEAGTTGFRISESYKPKESAIGGLPKLKIKALPKLKLNP